VRGPEFRAEVQLKDRRLEATAPSLPLIGNWKHIAVTYDGLSTVSIFYNGQVCSHIINFVSISLTLCHCCLNNCPSTFHVAWGHALSTYQVQCIGKYQCTAKGIINLKIMSLCYVAIILDQFIIETFDM
jgi:hypothetical protein